MKFTIIIQSSHLQSGNSAIEYILSAIEKGHRIQSIFFHLDGVYTAARGIDMPSDEMDLSQQWQNLLAEYPDLPLILCSNASLRRGLNAETILPGFQMGSMGNLVESCDIADRVITFGRSA